MFDLQVNGYRGVDFTSPTLTRDAFREACRQYLAEGADRFLPTLITAQEAVYERNLTLIAEVLDEENGFDGRIPGLHLEGPFLDPAPGAIGAHDPACVRPPDLALLQKMQRWSGGRVALMTLAANQPDAAAFCRHATANGTVISLGHHLASFDDLCRLRDAGATALTHLGNGMPNLVHRHDNPLLNGLCCDGLTIMLIADGHHLPARLVRFLIEAKGTSNVIVVSDAAPLAGLPPGRYETLGNRVVLEENGLLHNPEKQCLVGSSFSLQRCARFLREIGVDDAAANRMTEVNPTRLLGL
ncbi:MAG: hypothetical protein KA004_02115 [Verrucomicrobiales bacterium]|nr:hypothetical protein [Verrucomicrobiales bacterium]